MRSKTIRVIAGLALSCICLALLTWRVDMHQVASAFAHLRLRYLLLALAIGIVNLSFCALRWDLLFPPAERPGFWPCFSVLMIGNMGNMLLPARAGDVARVTLIGRELSLASGSRALATMGVEKVLDGIAVVLAAWIAVGSFVTAGWVARLIQISAVGFAVVLIALLAAHRYGHAAAALAGRVAAIAGTHWRDRATLAVAAFSDGLSALGGASVFVRAALFTVIIWAAQAASVWALALPLGVTLSWKAAVLVMAVLSLVFMVPAAPGGLGTYDLAGVTVLAIVHIGTAPATAVTVLLHAWMIVLNSVLGLVCLLASGSRVVGAGVKDEARPRAGTRA